MSGMKAEIEELRGLCAEWRALNEKNLKRLESVSQRIEELRQKLGIVGNINAFLEQHQ